MRRWKHIFAYLFLAVFGYFVAVTAGARTAFVFFITGAAFFELLFWKELLWPNDRRENAPGSPTSAGEPSS